MCGYERGSFMKRRQYSGEFKARVALEAIRGMRSINEIASDYEIHPHLVEKWKKQAMDSLPGILSDRRGKSDGEGVSSAKVDSLYQQIGQLQVELSFLKKRT